MNMDINTKKRFTEYLTELHRLNKKHGFTIDNAEVFDKGSFSGYIEVTRESMSIVLDDIVTLEIETDSIDWHEIKSVNIHFFYYYKSDNYPCH